jgi:hypothetical protein
MQYQNRNDYRGTKMSHPYLVRKYFSRKTKLKDTNKLTYSNQKSAFVDGMFSGTMRFFAFPFRTVSLFTTMALSFVFSGVLLNLALILRHPESLGTALFSSKASFADTLEKHRRANKFLNKYFNPTMHFMQQGFELLAKVSGIVPALLAGAVAKGFYRI